MGFGQECNIIYVSPNGSGSGTKAAPTSIQNALTIAGPGMDQIRMAEGTYPMSSRLEMVSGVTIDGGYDPSNWTKCNSTPTVIHRNNTNPTSVSIFGVYASGVTDFHLHDVSVLVDDAAGSGITTYGVYMVGCSDYSFNRVRSTAGNGSSGIDGVGGADGADGADGGNGQNGSDCSNGPNGAGAGGNGWSGGVAAGGNGGNGGALGGEPDFNPFNLEEGDGNNGVPGQIGGGVSPGAGGGAGQGYEYLFNDPCGTFGSCESGIINFGLNGADAVIDGANGANGTNGNPAHIWGVFEPGDGIPGEDGGNGSGGGGGGGGGSAGSGWLPFADPGTGAGGGGGGEGGQGGAGATAGTGGGGSFAFYISNNGTGGVLNDCDLNAGLPGFGGVGGFPGGLAGFGGLGGFGGNSTDGGCTSGGGGGAGSRAGNGGNGGNGSPGISQDLFQESTGIQVVETNLGANVEPEVCLGSTACTFSDIYYTTNANGIIEWFYEGTTVPQNTVGQSTIAQYSTMGPQDLTMVANGVPYFLSEFVNIFIDGSPYLPTIQAADTACPGDVVNFSSTWPINFNVLGYRWNFGDPDSGTDNTSAQATPTHTYAEAGTYMITLQTESPCCGWAKPDTHFIEILPIVTPEVFITATSTEICDGETITFGAVPFAGGQNPVFEWYVNGVATDIGPSFLLDPVVDGVQVQVRMQSSYACPITPFVTSETITIIVHPNPVIDCSNITDSYLGAQTGFDAQMSVGTAPFEFFWQFGDGGSATEQSPTNLYGGTGIYNASVEVTDTFGCSAICNVQVEIVLPPYVYGGFTIVEDPTCGSTEVQFTDTTVGNPTSWLWDFGDGNTSIDQNPTNSYTGTGPYTVTLSASNGVFTDTVVMPNLVSPWLIPTADFSASEIEVCDSVNIRFYDNSVNAATWEWDFGDIASGTVDNESTLQNPPHTFNDPGIYTVELTVYSVDGCQADANPLNITVNRSPVAGFSVDTNIVCTDLPISFTDNADVDALDIPEWLYHFNDKDTTVNFDGLLEESFTYTFDEAGWYIVTQYVEHTATGCKDSAKIFMEVRAHPIADFYPDSIALQLPDTVMQFWNNSSYSDPDLSFWDFGNRYTVDNQLDAEGVFQDSGLFDVQLIVMNELGCPDTIVKPFRVWEQETFFIQSAFTPNGDGVNDVFKIQEKGIVSWDMQIYDRWGKLVWQTNEVTDSWDGTHITTGMEVQQGAYTYTINLEWYRGVTFSRVGTITLIR